MIESRPLRFVVAVLALWAGLRALLLWPDGRYGGAPMTMLPGFGQQRMASGAPARSVTIVLDPPIRLAAAAEADADSPEMPGVLPAALESVAASPPDRDALLVQARGGSPLLAMLSLAGMHSGLSALSAAPDPRAPMPPKPGRLSGYGWIFVRDGMGLPGLADGGQLGGSQAGMRLDYAIARDLALTGRISAPLETRLGREAAIGLSWRPSHAVPVTLTVERRIALDKGARNAFAVMAAGGVGPIALPAGFRLEAYGQAGMVGLQRRDGFVDGAASATRTVLQTDNASLSIGGGIWGAAQPGVSRLDIGPRMRVKFDGTAANIGASLDWRQRIAGDAAPQSGLAVTLDGSF